MLEALVTAATNTDTKETASENFAEVDESGRLILPRKIAEQFGLVAGDQLYTEAAEDTFRLHRPVNRPARIYVEATTRCNMNCTMCQRHTWDAPPADMDPDIFHQIMEVLKISKPVPSIVFGGFGEPLMHPEIMTFIKACKKYNAPVELITNGLLLTRERLLELENNGVNRLWLSVDGAVENYDGHVRNPQALNRLLKNLKNMFSRQYYPGGNRLKLGFVFVAMEDNVHEFPDMMHLARSLNVDQILVSNLLPYTHEGLEQILYTCSTGEMSGRTFHVKLPRMDLQGDALAAVLRGLAHQDMSDFMNGEYEDFRDTCPFIKKASLSVGQDGRVSPCPPLLHSHSCFFQRIERKNRECSFGSLKDAGLLDIWNDVQYADFRKRVKVFDFSPCVSCASCQYGEANEEDCTGNTFPTCGGCLWAQGLIQCP